MPTLSTIIQYSSGSPSQINQSRETIKDIQTGNEEVKVSLCADDMVQYTKKPKDFTKNLFETINEQSKLAV